MPTSQPYTRPNAHSLLLAVRTQFSSTSLRVAASASTGAAPHLHPPATRLFHQIHACATTQHPIRLPSPAHGGYPGVGGGGILGMRGWARGHPLAATRARGYAS